MTKNISLTQQDNQPEEVSKPFLFLVFGSAAFILLLVTLAPFTPPQPMGIRGMGVGAAIALLSTWLARRIRKVLPRPHAYMVAMTIGAILGSAAAPIFQTLTAALIAGIIGGFLVPYPRQLWLKLESTAIQRYGKKRWQTFIQLFIFVALCSSFGLTEGIAIGAPFVGLLIGFIAGTAVFLLVIYLQWLRFMFGGAFIAYFIVDTILIYLPLSIRTSIISLTTLQLHIITITIGATAGLLLYVRNHKARHKPISHS